MRHFPNVMLSDPEVQQKQKVRSDGSIHRSPPPILNDWITLLTGLTPRPAW